MKPSSLPFLNVDKTVVFTMFSAPGSQHCQNFTALAALLNIDLDYDEGRYKGDMKTIKELSIG